MDTVIKFLTTRVAICLLFFLNSEESIVFVYLILTSTSRAFSDSCCLRLYDVLNGGEMLDDRGRLHELLLHVLNKGLFL